MSTTANPSDDFLPAGLLTPCDAQETDCDDRAQLRRWLRKRHVEMLVMSTVVVLGSLSLRAGADGKVAPAGFSQFKLPETCGSRLWFGVDCPGCGLTRSFIALARGDLSASLAYNRVGWVVALAVLLQFPYRVFALREMRTRLVERAWMKWFGWAMIAVLVGSWFGNMTDFF